MRQLLNPLVKRNAIEVVSGFGKVGAAALGSAVISKALKVSVDSFVNTVSNVKNSIKNS